MHSSVDGILLNKGNVFVCYTLGPILIVLC